MMSVMQPTKLPLLLLLPLLPTFTRADLPYNPATHIGNAIDSAGNAIGSNSHVQHASADASYVGANVDSFGHSVGSRIKTAGPVTGLSADGHYIHTAIASDLEEFGSAHPHVDPAYDWTQISSYFGEASTISDPQERSSLFSELRSYSSIYAAASSSGAVGPGGYAWNGAGTGATPTPVSTPPQQTYAPPPTTVTVTTCPMSSMSSSTPMQITPRPTPVYTPTQSPPPMYTGAAAAAAVPNAGINVGAMCGLAGFMGFMGWV